MKRIFLKNAIKKSQFKITFHALYKDDWFSRICLQNERVYRVLIFCMQIRHSFVLNSLTKIFRVRLVYSPKSMYIYLIN